MKLPMSLTVLVAVCLLYVCKAFPFATNSREVLWQTLGSSGAPQVEGSTCNFIPGTDRMYVVGGRTGANTWTDNVFSYYDVETKKWTQEHLEGEKKITQNGARSSHSTVEYEGKLYIFGGLWGPFLKHLSNDLLVLDPVARTISEIQTKGPKPSPRYSHAATVVDGKMYVHGGSVTPLGGKTLTKKVVDDLHVFNFKTNSWEVPLPAKANAPTSGERMGHELIAYQSEIYAIGGFKVATDDVTSSQKSEYHDDIMKYNIASREWVTVGTAAMKPPRSGHTAILVDGIVWVFGGHDQKQKLASVQAWDIRHNNWLDLQVTGGISARQGHCAAFQKTEGSPLFVYAGSAGYREYFNDLSVLYLKPSDRQWQKAPRSQTVTVPETVAQDAGDVFADRVRKLVSESKRSTETVAKKEIEDLQETLKSLGEGILKGAETEGDMLNVKRKIINCTELERHLNPMEEARKEHDAEAQKFQDFSAELDALAKTNQADQQTVHEITEKAQELQNQIEDKDREIKTGQQKYKEYATRTDRIKANLNTKKAEKVRAQEEQKATNAGLKTSEEQLWRTEKEHTTAQADHQALQDELDTLEAAETTKRARIVQVKGEQEAKSQQKEETDRTVQSATRDTGDIEEKIRKIEKVLGDRDGMIRKFEEADKADKSAREYRNRWIDEATGIDDSIIDDADALELKDMNPCSKQSKDFRIDEYIKKLQAILADLRRQLQAKQGELSGLETKLRVTSDETSKLEETVWQLEYDVKEIHRKKQRVLSDKESKATILSKAELDIKSKKAKVSDLKAASDDQKDKLRDLDDKLEEAEAEAKKEDEEFNGYQIKKSALEAESHKLVQLLKNELDKLEKILEERKQHRASFTDLKLGSSKLKNEYMAAKSKYDKHDSEFKKMYEHLFKCPPCPACTGSGDSSNIEKALVTQRAEMDKLQKQITMLTVENEKLKGQKSTGTQTKK